MPKSDAAEDWLLYRRLNDHVGGGCGVDELTKRCALEHSEPPTHKFQATLDGRTETGFLCEAHGRAAVDHDRIAFEEAGGTPEKLDELGPLLTDVRTELHGQRLTDPNREVNDGSLVTDRQQQEMTRVREERLARQWERAVGPDPWNLS